MTSRSAYLWLLVAAGGHVEFLDPFLLETCVQCSHMLTWKQSLSLQSLYCTKLKTLLTLTLSLTHSSHPWPPRKLSPLHKTCFTSFLFYQINKIIFPSTCPTQLPSHSPIHLSI
jgi:hypothetical protein